MNSTWAKGFTLVELLVSIGIFTIITAVSVFNYSSFNASILLTNLSYEIALSVRQAQFYGINVRQSTTDNKFDSGYGVHFDDDSTSYTLFEDTNKNHVYDSGTDVSLNSYTIQRGNKVSKLCVVTSVPPVNCTLTLLDLSFIRPNPDSFINKNGIADDWKTSGAQTAIICLTSPNKVLRKVVVESTGQISVSTSAPECI
ncbi:MAG: prepilin-type N-terminal cleavage/methylation domain-containing protein [Candidatus Paceibacterota bacterium]|jgi:prepilin-type N-terminal cleavage/methylation domain-containing protein